MTTSSTGREAPRVETTENQREPQLDLLNSLIGKWMTVGETIPADGAPGLEIHASDIYEWVPGGFFVVHTAYGSIGDSDVGGIEMIGYDAEAGRFRTDFFDSQSNVSNQDLNFRDGT